MSVTDFLKHIFDSPAQAAMFILMFITLMMVMKYTGLGIHYEKGKGFRFGHINRRARRESDGGTPKTRLSDAIDESMSRLEGKIDKLSDEVAILELNDLRILFYSNAPIISRMQNSLQYVSLGGNDATKEDIKLFALENLPEYKMICRLHPELKVFNFGEKEQ